MDSSIVQNEPSGHEAKNHSQKGNAAGKNSGNVLDKLAKSASHAGAFTLSVNYPVNFLSEQQPSNDDEYRQLPPKEENELEKWISKISTTQTSIHVRIASVCS